MSSHDSHIDPNMDSRVARRGFLARLSPAVAALASFTIRPERLRATSPLGANPHDPDAWIARLTGTHRLVLHTHQHFAPALMGARNVLVNGRDAYGVPESESNVAVATHGPAIAGLFRDKVWQRYAFGERFKIDDARTGGPAIRNPFLAPRDGDASDAVVPDLMRRGVLFLACNVAVRNLARRIAGEGDGADLHHELLAGLVPGVIVVPDLFVAIAHAQKQGVSYIFIDWRTSATGFGG